MIKLSKDILKNFLDSDYSTLDIDLIPVRELENMVQQLDPDFSMELDGSETNGWQIDFWYKYNCLGTKFTYSGSLHYGQCSLTKGDEDE